MRQLSDNKNGRIRPRNNEQPPEARNLPRQHRDGHLNNLLSGIPSLVRRRINNPFANLGAGRQNRRSSNVAVDHENMNYEQLLELEERIGHVSRGYSKKEIKAIPIMYSFERREESDCPICLDKIESDMPQLSIACRHQFHISCIKKSLQNDKKCPVCKTEAIDLL